MEATQFKIPCPKCGNLTFKPDNAGPEDVAKGAVSCVSCGHVLTIEDVNQFRAAVAENERATEAVKSLGQAVRDVFK